MQQLAEHNFSIATKIQVHEVFKAKLNKDVPKYTVLGACSPSIAYEALAIDKDFGVMMPCNVVVYEDGGKTQVTVKDPEMMKKAVCEQLHPLMDQIRLQMEAVLQSI